MKPKKRQGGETGVRVMIGKRRILMRIEKIGLVTGAIGESSARARLKLRGKALDPEVGRMRNRKWVMLRVRGRLCLRTLLLQSTCIWPGGRTTVERRLGTTWSSQMITGQSLR